MTVSPEIRVSVIVPTYRDWDRLALCLDALRRQTYPETLVEILIVNNDPQAMLPASLELAPNARLLEEERPGSYAARNRGLEEASGDLIAFTDSDCVPEPDWIANAVVEAGGLANKKFRITGPVRMFRDPRGSWLAWKFESVTAFNQKHNVRKGVAVTANLIVSRVVFERVGVFDAALFSGGDVAWNRLASQLGVPLVHSDKVVVNHPARVSMKEILNKSRRVFGGGYVQAQRERRRMVYVLRHLVPPLKYAWTLFNDGKPAASIVFACTVLWGLKILMLAEFVRLSLGAAPKRQ